MDALLIFKYISWLSQSPEDSASGFRIYESRMCEAIISMLIIGLLNGVFLTLYFNPIYLLLIIYDYPQIFVMTSTLLASGRLDPILYFLLITSLLSVIDDLIILSGGNPRFPYYW